jgi:putative signal transducing protein
MTDNTVVLRRYLSEIDAQIMAAVLEANGIPVQLLADTIGGAYPSMAMMYPVRFVVRAEDAERAAEILDGTAATADAADSEPDEGTPNPG